MSHAIWDQFCLVAEIHSDKTAVIDAVSGQSLSYKQLFALTKRFAAFLEGRSERAVAVVGESILDVCSILLACAATERCFVPLSDKEPLERVLDTLSHLPGPILLASTTGLCEIAEIDQGALGHTGLKWQVVEGKTDAVETLPFIVTHSSGTTGRPKPVAFSQRTKLHRTRQSINLFGISNTDTILSPTPLHHSLGQRHFFLAILTGATLVKAYPFNPDLWIKAVQTYNVNFAIPVSTHLKILQPRLLQNPKILAGFRCLVTSSSSAESEFKQTILDKADFQFWEIYGMTETACATAVHYLKGESTKHLGRAIQGTNIRIFSPNGQTDGEIEVLSDCLCDGYWGDPDRWSKALTSDGYFRSGDLGRLDGQGNLVFLGRVNESFESSGLLVFPAQVERVIAELPFVADCVAFGYPDLVFGNLVAITYIAGGDVSERQIILHARRKLPKNMWPARIFPRDTFPYLSSGKVDRQELIRQLTN
jgi:acyl-CoA synthetase (AMP-forming)/AMP-acid ligase II